MIVSGIDMVEIGRIRAALERNGDHGRDRFLNRIFTPAEQATCNGNTQRLAGRFAVKEAVAKALGTGIGDMRWVEIEVVTDERGAPHLALSGDAQRIANEQGVSSWSISISHTDSHAIGMAVGLKFSGAGSLE